ncbi:uncharacterized protein LOC144177830 [Haemaphysalis longicornis]
MSLVRYDVALDLSRREVAARPPCKRVAPDSAGLQRMLLNALEGISFLTDEVAKLREGNERLCRDNARAFAQQADVIASLRAEVRSLRGELSRRAGSFLPVPSPPSTPMLNGTAAAASLRREPSSTFAGAVANTNGAVADTAPDQPMPGSTTSSPSPLLGPPSGATPRTDSVKSNKKNPSIAVPRFTGYDDRKTVADFLSDLSVYKTASGASDEFVLTRVLPVALEASAGRWWRLQTPFASWADFEARFREEFLPPDYDYRIRRELKARTQHPREGLLEYIRAIQELFKRAIPGASDAEMVKHVLRCCHPRFRPFLHGRDYSSLEEMARSARAIEDALISELSYIPPPPVGEALEPACAWRDTYETSPQRSPQPRTAAAGLNSPRARGPSALGDRQLERGRPLDVRSGLVRSSRREGRGATRPMEIKLAAVANVGSQDTSVVSIRV